MSEIHVLIAEDWKKNTNNSEKNLKEMISSLGYEVIGHAKTAEEAMKVFEESRVDICVFDVHLAERIDGISLAYQVKRTYELPFIFLTSDPNEELCAHAKSLNPAAFILKPFDKQELKYALHIITAERLGNGKGKNSALLCDNKQTKPKSNNSIYLRKKERFERVEVDDILWAEAQSNYVKVQTVRSAFILSLTLQKLANTLLKSSTFERVHRSYLVNINKVTKISGNQLYVGEKAIPVSKNKKEEVFGLFKFL